MNRRELISTALAAPLLTSCISSTPNTQSLIQPVSKLTPNPGIDRDRAQYILTQANLDAVLLNLPENVYYASGDWPATTRMGYTDSAYAIMPRDKALPVIYVCNQFTFYYTASDAGLADDVLPYLVTGGTPDNVSNAIMFKSTEPDNLIAKEHHRKAATNASAPFHASMQAGIETALKNLGMKNSKIGYDSANGLKRLESAASNNTAIDARDIFKHIRLVKTPREIELMRRSSAINVEAATKTAKNIRALRTSSNVRNQFYSLASQLGNVPVFMVVNGSINEQYDEELQDGTAVLIDCVSAHHGYKGDYGRTIFIGEPNKVMYAKVNAMGKAWSELRQSLKPGMRFSEIRMRGAKILKNLDSTISVPFNPHCVGLAHTEHPNKDYDGNWVDLTLEKGMIISVDCPLMEVGRMGTAHLEDLTLITESGNELIHDGGNQFFIV